MNFLRLFLTGATEAAEAAENVRETVEDSLRKTAN